MKFWGEELFVCGDGEPISIRGHRFRAAHRIAPRSGTANVKRAIVEGVMFEFRLLIEADSGNSERRPGLSRNDKFSSCFISEVVRQRKAYFLQMKDQFRDGV